MNELYISFLKTFHRGLNLIKMFVFPNDTTACWDCFQSNLKSPSFGLFVDWKIVPVQSTPQTCQFDQKALDTLLTRLDLLFFHFMSDKRRTGKNNLPSIFRIEKQHILHLRSSNFLANYLCGFQMVESEKYAHFQSREC